MGWDQQKCDAAAENMTNVLFLSSNQERDLKIAAAVSTLTEALGSTCNVEINAEYGVKQVDPVDGWRNYERDPSGNKVIITITVRNEQSSGVITSHDYRV